MSNATGAPTGTEVDCKRISRALRRALRASESDAADIDRRRGRIFAELLLELERLGRPSTASPLAALWRSLVAHLGTLDERLSADFERADAEHERWLAGERGAERRLGLRRSSDGDVDPKSLS